MDGLDLGEGNLVYGVIVKTKTGNYGMLQLENIWKGGSELAWSAGFKTKEVHGNSLRSTPYAATSGDTIVEISYLTSKGEYSVHLADGLYLPKKHNGTVNAESVAVAAGQHSGNAGRPAGRFLRSGFRRHADWCCLCRRQDDL